jgi:hypothetical protein
MFIIILPTDTFVTDVLMTYPMFTNTVYKIWSATVL